MTTFQAIVYAMIHGISQFLPISPTAHHVLIPYLVGWEPPPVALLGAMTLAAFSALMIFFRHDWASMISCLLQVIIYRKRPMTLDERLPLFILISFIPTWLTTTYLNHWVNESQWTPLVIAFIFAGTGLILWVVDSMSRKSKGIYDWNWFDASVVGLLQAVSVVPGFDAFTAVLIAGLFLNYRRDTATKYAYFTLAPLLLISSISRLKDVNFHAAAPSPDLTWLSFGIAFVVTFFIGLLCIGGFTKHVLQKGLGQYAIYRWVLAIGVGVAYWVKTQG